MPALLVNRPELFPAGTVVKAYQRPIPHPPMVQGYTGAPAGTLAGECTPGPKGELELANIPAARYMLWAEVGGKDVYLLALASGVSGGAGSQDKMHYRMLVALRSIAEATAAGVPQVDIEQPSNPKGL